MSTFKRKRISFIARLRNYFITGIVVLIPIGLTLYLTKFIIDEEESKRFLNDVQNLRNMTKSELHKLNIKVKSDQKNSISKKAIF